MLLHLNSISGYIGHLVLFAYLFFNLYASADFMRSPLFGNGQVKINDNKIMNNPPWPGL